MTRVGRGLTRGIAFAAVAAAFLGSPLPPSSSRLDHALALVRNQDFSAVFDTANDRIEALFSPGREDRFIEEVFGFSGKWKAVTRGDASYERFVRRTFERTVLGRRDLEELEERIRGDYEYALAAAENRLRVALYEDISPGRPGLTFNRFGAEYDRLTRSVAPQVLADLGMNVVAIGGSEAAAFLAVASTGILGVSVAAGVGTGWWTFGIGLAAGVAAGIAIDAAVGDVSEDAARMEIRSHLNDLRNRVINDVHAALGRSLAATIRIQEECVRGLVRGGRDESAARH